MVNKNIFILSMVLLLSACTVNQDSPSISFVPHEKIEEDTFDIPSPQSGNYKYQETTVAASVYHTHISANSSVEGALPFFDIKGNAITDNVTPNDWCLTAIEGTGITTFKGERVVITYDGRRNGKREMHIDCAKVLGKEKFKTQGYHNFALTTAPYGKGIGDKGLVPYRTLATDNVTFKAGTVIYIDEFKDKYFQLKPGKWIKHDGYFIVVDTGSNDYIKEKRVDVYCGTDVYCFQDAKTSDSQHIYYLPAKIVTEPSVIERLKKLFVTY